MLVPKDKCKERILLYSLTLTDTLDFRFADLLACWAVATKTGTTKCIWVKKKNLFSD